MSHADSYDPCSLDALPASRREFLRGAAAALGALALLGVSEEQALAMPVRLVTGARTGAELRFPIPAEDTVIFDSDHDLILVRRGAQAWAFVAACPHKEVVKLKFLKGENRFQCPKHESKYQPDGTFISGKATRHMDRLPIRKDGNELVIDPDRAWLSDANAAGWSAAVVAL
jgi:nitrite reductase/ring-hydroxylating ferredoxin subunit